MRSPALASMMSDWYQHFSMKSQVFTFVIGFTWAASGFAAEEAQGIIGQIPGSNPGSQGRQRRGLPGKTRLIDKAIAPIDWLFLFS